MDAKYRQDVNLKRRFLAHHNTDEHWKRFLNNVECQDAFEQKKVLKDRRSNCGHCSYFHRWFQHPIWRLGQARVGNGPYTLAGGHHEPVVRNFEIPDMHALPDQPSKAAYQKYANLLDAWENEITIPVNTSRPLGAPACGTVWDETLIRNAFKSTTGITPNMLEWIVESAFEEALLHPHPSNMVNLMDETSKDRYGRTTCQGQFNMIFNYLSGEENNYLTVPFWFEKNRMVTSLSYNN
eukprot:4025817-Amphidinium_carterae.2